MINKIVSILFLTLLLICGTLLSIVVGGAIGGYLTFQKVGSDLVKVINDEIDLNDIF